jgi:bacillithiol system protein YtxJ
MENQFTSVTSTEALEHLLTQSHDGPVVLFKHSTTCPISSAAYKQMSHLEADVALIVVQSARDVSREIEARTGVEHESPQALVLRNGAVVWSASHWDVTADAVARAMREHA